MTRAAVKNHTLARRAVSMVVMLVATVSTRVKQRALVDKIDVVLAFFTDFDLGRGHLFAHDACGVAGTAISDNHTMTVLFLAAAAVDNGR